MEESENNSFAALSIASVSAAELNVSGVDQDITAKVQQLELEKKKLQAEFNMQRAKLKELFIQKESEYAKCQSDKQSLKRELDEMKSQFVVADLKSANELQLKEQKAQEEISSLQQLVQETIEESSICKTELQRMKEESSRLWLENRELRDGQQQQHQQHHQQESNSLGPHVLNQVKKTLARKLGGDSNAQPDSVEANSKKEANKYAQEDAEVLNSIVVQLQEEMKALKEKLRDADDQLQTKSAASNQLDLEACSINKSTSMEMHKCDTCHSYESKVQTLLKKQTEDEEKIEQQQRSLEESREDLKKEAALRKQLEDEWQEKRELHKTEVQKLREHVKRNEIELLDLQQKFLDSKEEILRQLQRLTDDRERVNKHLDTLQADNDFLSGRYLATAEEIESQYINLPDTVPELQELMLRQQSELIQARVGSQYEKQKCVTSLDEIQILRDQLEACNNEHRSYKKKVHTEMKSLQDRLTQHLVTMQNFETTKNELERKEVELNRQISENRVEIIELQEKNEKLNRINIDCKSKIKNLQEDLSTSEQVQKDFVKLSQTLQMSLEKLRHADAEVRWQDDDDVDNCSVCNAYFTVTVRKFHCRHCGNIYCDKCLSKTVPSGPRNRMARVCDICHTLLTPNTAPYFSHEPQQQQQHSS